MAAIILNDAKWTLRLTSAAPCEILVTVNSSSAYVLELPKAEAVMPAPERLGRRRNTGYMTRWLGRNMRRRRIGAVNSTGWQAKPIRRRVARR